MKVWRSHLATLNCHYGKSAWSFFHFLLIIYFMACTNIIFVYQIFTLVKGFILINVPWLAQRTKIYTCLHWKIDHDNLVNRNLQMWIKIWWFISQIGHETTNKGHTPFIIPYTRIAMYSKKFMPNILFVNICSRALSVCLLSVNICEPKWPITNMAWVRAWLCKLQKGCTRFAAASDKVYQLLAHGRWFYLGIPASSTTKNGGHDISEILLKVALNTIYQIK